MDGEGTEVRLLWSEEGVAGGETESEPVYHILENLAVEKGVAGGRCGA